MKKALGASCAALTFALIALFGQGQSAFSAATLLPNGEQCFAATTSTSGGSVGPIGTLGALTGGSGYAAGGTNTFTNVPLTGGSGFGAIANITVTAGIVTGVGIVNPGAHYVTNDSLSAAAANLGGSGSGFSVVVVSPVTAGTGMVGLLGPITAGTGGTSGTYGGVNLTGGTGSGASANITVAGGGVTGVAILNPGTGYSVGDTLSASSAAIGNVTGFSVSVSSTTINSALAGGSVAFYVPNTFTFKQTWKDPAQTQLNQNPVALDANGCATIYGSGQYRQVLMDSLGNIIWDRLTADTTAGNNVLWAGVALASGTANAIVLTVPSFSGVDGTIINFIPLLSNTGATTINPSSFGNVPVLKDTTLGPVALTGNEIIAGSNGNIISVQYSAAGNSFQLLNTVIPATAATTTATPLCGASGLKITNGSSPNSIAAITARTATMVNASGFFINRLNLSVTVNISLGNSTPTAGGMDGEAPGTNSTIDLFIIDNGTAPSALGSLASGNGLFPSLPAGYGYICYLGAMLVDGSGNLKRTTQLGANAEYTLTSGTNTTQYPLFANGGSGSCAAGSFTPVGLTGDIPPTATKAKVTLVVANATTAALSPNNNVPGPSGGTGGTAPLGIQSVSGLVSATMADFVLATPLTLYYCSNGASNAASAVGWTDAVNAN